MIARWKASWERDPLRWSLFLVLLVALASSTSGLGNLFAYDDVPMLVENPMVNRLHAPWAYLTDSYWGPTRGNSLYRPITVMAFALEWAVGKGSPFPFHLANVVLYALTSLAVLALLRVLLPKGAALIGALFWAAHPAHVEAVANVVGQSEMLAALPMLIAVTVYMIDRRAGALRVRTLAVVGVCFAFALLTKEHGILLPALLMAAEAAFRGRAFADDGEGRARAWLLARILLLELVVYLAVRYLVLSGFAGDAPHPALEGLGMGQRVWVMVALVPEFVRLLWWPAALYADYSPQMVPVLTSPSLGHLAGALWLLLTFGLLMYGWRRDRIVAFAVLWMGLALGPISNILVATGVLVAERTLCLASVGVALLLGRGCDLARAPLAAFPKRWVRVALPALAALLLVSAVAQSADRQRMWMDNPTIFSTTVVDAPTNFRAHYVLGELFGGLGARERAEKHLRTADSLYPGYDLVELSLARVLHFEDRCAEALPLYDIVLSKRPDAEIARVGRTACLLEARRLSEARDEALRGLGLGRSSGPFGLLLQKAESSLVATDTVDIRNRWFRAGGKVSKSDERLRVPVLYVRPSLSGQRSRMRQP
ncbi:MAG: tetratricopeptide repeat protein [Gemmatimonadetes bacterium]|nr:tetratricopeptide repeat protein [Gemmatimonadota bacterium]